MAMKELVKFTLDAKQIRRACEQYVGPRINAEVEVADAIVPADYSILIIVSKKRAPRKAKVAA